MIYVFIFFIGLFLGSFLQVLVDRIQSKENPFFGRSHCHSCHHVLAWYDLFPVFSYFFLKRKCRYCHRPIGWKYPAVEITTGAVLTTTVFFVVTQTSVLFLNPLSILQVGYYCLMSFFFLLIFFSDLFYGIIPDVIVVSASFTAFFYILFTSFFSLPHFILSGLGLFFFFFLLFALTNGRGMGFGDVKFSFLIGLFLGFPNAVLAIYVAFLTGAMIALILILWRKKKLRGSTIPFGPFMVFGAFFSLFWGDMLLHHFLHW